MLQSRRWIAFRRGFESSLLCFCLLDFRLSETVTCHGIKAYRETRRWWVCDDHIKVEIVEIETEKLGRWKEGEEEKFGKKENIVLCFEDWTEQCSGSG